MNMLLMTSRDQKGQGHDPKIFGANIISTMAGWRYSLGCNGAPLGNETTTWRSHGHVTDDVT